MKLRKIITMGLAAVMAVSAMSISAFAADDEAVTTSDNIDYSIYDSDMVYVQEDADRVAEYNAQMQKRRDTSYTYWNWSNGIYSKTTGETSSIIIPYYFIPSSNYLYFNIGVDNAGKNNSSANEVPRLAVNILTDSGTLDYVGSYDITSVGDHSYEWTNKKRSLTSGKKYVFLVNANTNWGSSYIDIYKSSM